MNHKNNKKTLVFGASLNKFRSSYQALIKLIQMQYNVVAIGGREGQILGVPIVKGHPELKDIHTITIYMGEKMQEEHEDYLLSIHPKRIIFNPGAENRRLAEKAREKDIITENACTSVLLSIGEF